MAAKPRIHLIATGGTIAGTAADPTDTRNYTAGVLTAEQLIASVPPLKDLAEISVEQLYNLDSKDMAPEHWLGLARATQAALARDDVDGVVITHGTDTMEESAFFLDLVLPPGKPVVFTGAMRPATALSADGPMNLFEAVSVVIHPDFQGIGVLVVMNDQVHSARYVSKTRAQGTDAFTSLGLGPLGWANPPRLCLVPPPVPHPPIDLAGISSLPRVDILSVAAGSTPDLIEAAIFLGAKGIVLALPGDCSVPGNWISSLQAARFHGVPVAEVLRTGGNGTLDTLTQLGLASPSPYSAVQARIVMMLRLAADE